jgi:hypothetical protein
MYPFILLFTNGSHNRCGVYTIKLEVDGELRYHFQTDEFSFSESRFIHAHTDYALREKENKRVHSLFIRPNNPLSMYKETGHSGIMSLPEKDSAEIKIEISDFEGNTSYIVLSVAGEKAEEVNSIDNTGGTHFRWYEENNFTGEGLSLRIPSAGLYENTDFNYSRVKTENELYPWIHRIHTPEVPLHKWSHIRIKTGAIPENLQEKLCLIRLGDNQRLEYAGGEYREGGFLEGRIREFGQYTIGVDSIAPLILALDTKSTQSLKGQSEIRFLIRDDLSGIASYNGYIDEEWVLFEFDAKNDLLRYVFDEERIKKGKEHRLELRVSDRKGNTGIYKKTIQW